MLTRLELPRFDFEATYVDPWGKHATLFGWCKAHTDSEAREIAESRVREDCRGYIDDLLDVKINPRARKPLPLIVMTMGGVYD